MCKPFIVFLLLVACGFTFFILRVAPFFKFWRLSSWQKDEFIYNDDITVGLILNWTFYSLFYVLAMWSLYVMVFNTPGYIPRQYKYDMDKMNKCDQVWYKYLKDLQHTTQN